MVSERGSGLVELYLRAVIGDCRLRVKLSLIMDIGALSTPFVCGNPRDEEHIAEPRPLQQLYFYVRRNLHSRKLRFM